MQTQEAVDQAKAQAFAVQVLHDTSRTLVTLMAAIGDRLGLFKALAADGPATSVELAGRAGIHERYAREWLATMLSAGYLAYEPAHGRFSLPPEHVPALAQESGPLYFGGTHQMLLGMIGPLDLLRAAFRSGGGIPMSAYGEDTWDGMERDMAGAYEWTFLQQLLPAVPAVQALLERGVRVADVGCGRGRALIKLAQAFPNSRYVGYDVFEPNVARARANAAAAGVSGRIHFETLDASAGLPERFDVITTFDVVHDAADPLGLLRAIRQGLNPEGLYLCLDVQCSEDVAKNTRPMDTLRYGFSLLYCMTTSLANGGEGLGTLGLTEPKMGALCREAGFGSVRVVPQDDAFHTLYEARR